MRIYTYTLLVLILTCVGVSAQTNLDSSLTNWANMPDIAATPSEWIYNAKPAFYFWAGASVSFTLGMFGFVMRLFRRLDMNDMIGGGE